jgi:imidazolonepropionase
MLPSPGPDDPGANRPPADLIITGASEVLTCAGATDEPLGRIPGAVLAIGDGRVLAVGRDDEVRSTIDSSGALVLDAAGGVVVPGFIDAHTHLVFGGSRAKEYALRLTRSAEEVRELGVPTGIMATVGMTRAEDAETLHQSAAKRLDAMLAHGTTTVESKSGYGLDIDNELKLLDVNRRLDEGHDVDVVSTFMGAHDFPPELSRDAYVVQIVDEMIPRVAGDTRAGFCDVFCDAGFFTVDQSRRILEAGAEAGLRPKIHADQYSEVGGARLAAELGVVSADHLNFTGAEALRLMADVGVTAVLMPLIDFAVQHPRPIRARDWVEAGLTIGLGTDLCPGGYAVSMPLALQFACRWNGLSPAEALVAATAGSAAACGLTDRGSLRPGALADVQVWSVPTLEDMVYRIGDNPVRNVVKRGKVVV